jgi:glycosyltransferase involved in cell wall biosynthesis
MKIAYVAVKGIPIGGGIEKLTEEIGKRLVRKGHEVLIYSSRDYGTSDGYYEGMEIKTVPSLNTKSFHKLSICCNATLDVLKRNDVDIVHFHAVGPSLFSIIPRLKNVPTVVQTHGLEWKRDKWGAIGRNFFKLADLTAVFFPDCTTSVSNVQKRYYENKFGKTIVYIPTGVNRVKNCKPDWILKKGLTPNEYILFAARLVEEKGAHFLIEAFKNIDTNMKLVIAGDAAYSEGYKTNLHRIAGDDERIVFTGFLTGNPLEELFSNAYLFCLPSTLEGLPIALLEAMSYGNCCLASDIPENLEAIENYGYKFQNRNPDDLQQKLEMLIQNPEKVKTKKQAAKKHVLDRYTWDRISDEIETLYLSLLS